MKKSDLCPWCGKGDCVRGVAFDNVEAYGTRSFKLLCVHCKKPIEVSIVRRAYLIRLAKGTHKADDF